MIIRDGTTRLADIDFIENLGSRDADVVISSFSDPAYFQIDSVETINGTTVTAGRFEINDFSGIQLIADTTAGDPIVEFLQRGDEAFEAVNSILSRYC